MDESLLELILEMLGRAKGGVAIDSLIEGIDYLEHIRCTFEEIEEALVYLGNQGLVIEENGKWFRA